jgi:hypothetical protein
LVAFPPDIGYTLASPKGDAVRKLLTVAMLLALISGSAFAQEQQQQEVTVEDVVVQQLAKMAQLFDAYTKAAGGAGRWHGFKARLKSLYTTDPYVEIEKYRTWVPAFLAKAKGMSAYDPYTETWLGDVLKCMPTRNDTHASCKAKLANCVAFVFRGKPADYHQEVMDKIKTQSGLDWL